MALVIGGSGMLGSAIMDEMGCAGTHFRNPKPGTVEFDPAILKNYRVIINCACDKYVDRCERDFFAAKRVNADLVDTIIAANPRCHLIQISTDYVMSSTDVVDPLSVYGTTKLLGELKAKKAHTYTILRVPSLYDDPSDALRDVLDLTTDKPIDARYARYHTSVRDVAKIIEYVVAQGLTGTLRFSAPLARSKFQLANCIGIDRMPDLTRTPYRPSHVFLGSSFDMIPQQLDLSQFELTKLTRDMFFVLDLDGTLLDTVGIHQQCYDLAPDRDTKTKMLKLCTKFSLKWNAEVLIDFIEKYKVNHVVLTNTTRDVVDHFRKCVPKLRSLKNFVTKDSYRCRKPDPEPYELAMRYCNQPNVYAFDDNAANLEPMKKWTRRLFHMSDTVVDHTVFTLNDFARLVNYIRC